MKKSLFFLVLPSILALLTTENLRGQDRQIFTINEDVPGLNVMAFQDFYPDGHQGGITVIQNGIRVLANGDVRLEDAPGQWSPIPKKGQRIVDPENNEIRTTLWYPDSSRNGIGFNPIKYPDIAAELYLSTGDKKYMDFISGHRKLVTENIKQTAPAVSRIANDIHDKAFIKELRAALIQYASDIEKRVHETPFGVEYKPNIWGAGWGIQNFGVNQYFLHRGFPDIFSAEPVFSALNFILGVHPGMNTASFVSGVGERSVTVAYGFNRVDWTYIPGGSLSGTALIRPDLAELKIWPYFWQQTEYVMGGGATNYMFLVLAAKELLK